MTSETESKKISRKVDRTTNNSSGSNRTRPTIGYLVVRTEDNVSQALWRGVAEAAREQDVNLICFAGDRLLFPDGTVSPANAIYDLVNSEVVDGLVTWASSVGGSLEHEETVAFHQCYHPLPIVSITLPMEGCPTVLIDSYAGMSQSTRWYRRQRSLPKN
jgi:DNA-binding LacI/PurR family transcriptional regulator